jgi:hypothetical protein
MLEALQALRVRRAHPAVLRLPAIEGLIADPVPAADLRRRRPALLLTQRPDDLRLAKPTLPHRPSPDDGLSYRPGIFGGAGQGRSRPQTIHSEDGQKEVGKV